MKTCNYRLKRLADQTQVVASAMADFLAHRGFQNEQAALDRLNEAVNFSAELATAAMTVRLADDD